MGKPLGVRICDGSELWLLIKEEVSVLRTSWDEGKADNSCTIGVVMVKEEKHGGQKCD